MVVRRQTAYKIWIGDILKGEYHEEQGEWDPNYVLVKDRKVARINLIATVVEKLISGDGSMARIELDDGSGTIRSKAWREDIEIIRKVNVGDLVLLVGRLRKFGNEVYITPEIIKALSNSLWTRVRKLELEKEFGKPPYSNGVVSEKIEPEVNVVTTVSESKRQKILNYIGKEEEVRYEKVISEAGVDSEEAKKVITELLKEGEVYQNKPGYLKII